MQIIRFEHFFIIFIINLDHGRGRGRESDAL